MILLGAVLFLLGAIMPILAGVFLCSVQPSHRIVACSISSTLQLFGHMLSPFVYGLVS